MKVSLVLLIALAAARSLRTQSAAVRHAILAAAIGCAALMPLLERVVPQWHVPLRPAYAGRAEPRMVSDEIGSARVPSRSAAVPRNSASASTNRSMALPVTDITSVLRAIWVAGFSFAVFVLTAGLGRLAWLASRARRLTDGRWTELTQQIAREYGIRRPVVVLQSDHPSLLVTWGVRRPRIILPAPAADWPEDIVEAVLAHELAHIQRGDWVAQMIGECLRAVYWFNPIVWIVCGRLRLESEHACDDVVMSRGVSASDYAGYLLDLARALGRRRPGLPAPAIARRSTLQRRITAMLNAGLTRNPMSNAAHMVTMLIVLVVTAAVAAAQIFGSVAGTVADPQGGVLPNVTLTLSSSARDTKYEVRSDRAGRFEFVGVPDGDYVLEARIPGFMTFRRPVHMAGQAIHQPITLRVGSLEETVTITDAVVADGSAGPVQIATPRANPPCNSSSAGEPQIGGNIRPPRRIRDAAPQYPQTLRGTGTEGVVVMEGYIGLDGFVRDLQVRSGAHPDLAKAAVSAVREWQWDSTLLNCVPVEVAITVTAKFVHQP